MNKTEIIARGVAWTWHDFTAALTHLFDQVETEVITFDNPLQGRGATATVYLATARTE